MACAATRQAERNTAWQYQQSVVGECSLHRGIRGVVSVVETGQNRFLQQWKEQHLQVSKVDKASL